MVLLKYNIVCWQERTTLVELLYINYHEHRKPLEIKKVETKGQANMKRSIKVNSLQWGDYLLIEAVSPSEITEK